MVSVEPRACDPQEPLLSAFAAEGKVTHVYTVSLATVNASHNTGLRNIENLTISQLAVWYSSGEVKGLVS